MKDELADKRRVTVKKEAPGAREHRRTRAEFKSLLKDIDENRIGGLFNWVIDVNNSLRAFENWMRADIDGLASGQRMLSEQITSLITVVEHCTRLLKEKETLQKENDALRAGFIPQGKIGNIHEFEWHDLGRPEDNIGKRALKIIETENEVRNLAEANKFMAASLDAVKRDEAGKIPTLNQEYGIEPAKLSEYISTHFSSGFDSDE